MYHIESCRNSSSIAGRTNCHASASTRKRSHWPPNNVKTTSNKKINAIPTKKTIFTLGLNVDIIFLITVNPRRAVVN